MGCNDDRSAICKIQKRLNNTLRQLRTIARRDQLMSSTINHQQLCLCGNQLQRSFHLHLRSEPIPLAAYKQCRCLQRREVRRSHLFRTLGRMQWIGKQQQALNKFWCTRDQYRRLPATVGVPTEKDPAGCLTPHCFDCGTQAFLILFRSSHRRPMRPGLAKGQITSQHRHSRRTKRLRQRPQQWRLAVGSSAMRQHQAIRISVGGPMQKPSHRRVYPRMIFEFFAVLHPPVPLTKRIAT